MLESDVVEDQNDFPATCNLWCLGFCKFLRGLRKTNILRDEDPDEHEQQSENGDEGEESDRAERASSRREPASSPLPSEHDQQHFRTV